MTISISVAPSATAIRISSNLSLSGVCPAGNPVATLAIGMCGAPAAFFGLKIQILKYFCANFDGSGLDFFKRSP